MKKYMTCPICKKPQFYNDAEYEYMCDCGFLYTPRDKYNIDDKDTEISRDNNTYDGAYVVPEHIIKKIMHKPGHDEYNIDDFDISSLYTLTDEERIQFLEKRMVEIKYMTLNNLRCTTVLCDDVYDVVKTLAKTSELSSPKVLSVMNFIINLYSVLGVEIKPENHICLPLKNGKHTSLFELVSTLTKIKVSLDSHHGATGIIIKNSDITRNKH